MANQDAWDKGVEVGEKNMEQIHKTAKGPAGMIGSKKHGGKIKKTGRYKLHKGEEEKSGSKVIRKIGKTGPYHAVKGEHIVTAKNVKKRIGRKRVASKRG
jgi:hypothetical protein